MLLSRGDLVPHSVPNQPKIPGDTPLHSAAFYGRASVAEVLLSAAEHYSPMLVVELLFARNAASATPLHVAACSGHKKVCAVLLDWADKWLLGNVLLKCESRQGLTPLSYARAGYTEGKAETIQWLTTAMQERNCSKRKLSPGRVWRWLALAIGGRGSSRPIHRCIEARRQE